MASVHVQTILTQLTLDEKIRLLAGKNFWETHEIDRLQIPSLKVTDGPSGARGEEFRDGTRAACFPACVSLASTFDRKLARRIGKALAEETQTKGAYVLLGPTVCIHRSPLGGRNFESFSEDPLLAGLMASEYIKGLQGERVAATIKHFFANEQETRRFVVDEKISERALREIYLKPFEIAIKESDPWCLMSAYPKVNGSYIDATDKWLDEVLRKQWGFNGLTMSDWGAGTTVESVRNGLDLEMPGPANSCAPSKVHEALKDGRISVADIDARVLKSLELLEKVGKFADRRPTPLEQAIDRPEHRALIREAGAAGIVLLKNDNRVLPIDLKATKKIALLGPLAKEASAHGGGSSFLTCHYKISPFEAFTGRFGDQVEFSFSKGAHIFRSLPDLLEGITNSKGNQGFDVAYFENHEATGEPFDTAEVIRSYFATHDQLKLKEKAMSARLSTSYRPTQTGRHYLSLSGAGRTRLFVNDELIAEQDGNVRDAMAFISGVQDELRVQYPFETSRTYQIRVDTSMPTESVSDSYILDKQLCAHIGFVSQSEMEQDLQDEAVSLARDADIAIVFTGNTFQWESEGQDMDAMVLPPYNNRVQDELVKAVAAVNPRTIVVNNTGVAVELPWLDDVAGLLQAWYGGQEIGNAIVDVLVGDVDASGRLPMSWPRLYEHTDCHGHFGLDSLDSREVEYTEGVFVGYRHFDLLWNTDKQVLFPFGYGLSYTTFELTNMSVSGHIENDVNKKVFIAVKVKNTGERAGCQTVQVYLAPPKVQELERPVKTMAGFAKVELNPGEERVITVEFGRDAAAHWDEMMDQWKVEGGSYEITVSTSSRPDDVTCRGCLVVQDGFVFAP